MKNTLFAGLLLLLMGCSGQSTNEETLPIAGYRETVEVDGKVDTIYHTIKDFKLVDQDSNFVTLNTFEDKVYVADFFFTTCPSICPIMKQQMLTVYERFIDNPEVMLLSHTIDPAHDTVAVLREYAELLEVSSDKWHFVTGEMDDIYTLAEKSYFAPAMEDEEAPGGFLHNGAFILVDKEKRIRGFYDGTDEMQVKKLIRDIPVLLKEYDASDNLN